MPRLHETVHTRVASDEAFAFVADFANNPAWDPNTVSAERLDDGPLGVGARYRLDVKLRGGVAPMTYVVTAWEPSSRVVLEGVGSNVVATDEIRFAPDGDGTRIEYIADIRLTGWMRLLEPLAGGAFDRIAKNAAAGMHRELEALTEVAA